MRDIFIYLLYVLFITFFSYLILIVLTIIIKIHTNSRLKKWKDWIITGSEFKIGCNDAGWRHVAFRNGDVISSQEIIVDGKKIPWKKFTNNIIFPHLMAILGEKYNIKIIRSRNPITNGQCARLLFLWPIFILLVWYFPIFFLEIPKDFDLNLRCFASVAVGGCWLSGCGFVLFSHFLKKRLSREYEMFENKVQLIKKELKW
jgi:hypothetical protein